MRNDGLLSQDEVAVQLTAGVLEEIQFLLILVFSSKVLITVKLMASLISLRHSLISPHWKACSVLPAYAIC